MISRRQVLANRYRQALLEFGGGAIITAANSAPIKRLQASVNDRFCHKNNPLGLIKKITSAIQSIKNS